MDKVYVSTRDKRITASASQAITQGLADDGGLFVPTFIDSVSFDLEQLKQMSYSELTYTILSAFLDFDPEVLKENIKGAYESGKFETIPPVITTSKGERHILELYHGPTAAFKDMALTLLPYLLKTSAENIGETREIVILTATSGDTGKAALEGFRDVKGTKIIVFYPKDGVSPVQELQMRTTEGENTFVIGVEGNFDDTQTGVKEIFSDAKLRDWMDQNGYVFSSANSINIGRLLPQIVYYYKAYFDLIDQGVLSLGDPVNFCVPTGNFGDILAGYYAAKTGLPVNKLICASNQNKILTDFFQSGVYDRRRPFYKTSSPSMDILISSNLERLLFDKFDKDPQHVAECMKRLSEEGVYDTDASLFPEFYAGYADEEETKETIKKVFEETGELIDTHTAVAEKVREDYVRETGDRTPCVVLSTASPYKFSVPVYEALFGETEPGADPLDVQDTLSQKTGVPQPKALLGLKEREIRHHTVCDVDSMQQAVIQSLKEA